MDYDDFVAHFGEPLQNKEGTILFETYGDDLEKVLAADPKSVWTLVDEDGEYFLAPGFHLVNRVSYVIASKPRRNPSDNCWFVSGSE